MLKARDDDLLEANMSKETRLKRLRYQSWHRGCKETDVLLGNFCDHNIQKLNDVELALFEALLEEDDYDIWQWVGHNVTPSRPEYAPLIEQLRQSGPHVTR